jgi:hypothetical protein
MGGVDVQNHFFFTSALAGGKKLGSRPCRFTQGKKKQYPLYRRLRGPQSRSGRGENSWPHLDSNSDPSAVQTVASLYTDYAIPPLFPDKIQCSGNEWENF